MRKRDEFIVQIAKGTMTTEMAVREILLDIRELLTPKE
jgi:hypothetical protein